MNFSDFGLHPDLLEGIDAMNYTTATPIQEQAIPIILQGRDLIGTAQTGTGKTAAFVLPLIHLIMESGEAHYTQALVVVPTRELALQIEKVISAYAYFADVSCLAVYGGGDAKSFGQEKTAITSGADIIIATPGRLIAHMNLGYVDFSRLRFLVLDEADRMMDMGFKPDLMKIVGKLNPKRQTLLFSATMPLEVMRFAKGLVQNPATVSIALSKPAEGVTQGAYMVDERLKPALMTSLLRERPGQKTIVFGSSKQSVHTLYQALRAKGLPVSQISSDLEQEQREQVMLEFRNGKIEILVATDVLSRGIDVDNIDLVVNYDVPRAAEDYVHRIGRTARAARTGTALTLVSSADLFRFKRIEKLIGKEVPRIPLPPHLAKMKVEAPAKRTGSGSDRHKKSKPGPRKESQAKTQESPDPNAVSSGTATPAAQNERKKKRRHRGGNRNKPRNRQGPNGGGQGMDAAN